MGSLLGNGLLRRIHLQSMANRTVHCVSIGLVITGCRISARFPGRGYIDKGSVVGVSTGRYLQVP